MTKVKHLIQAMAQYGMEQQVVIRDRQGIQCDVTLVYSTDHRRILVLEPTPKTKPRRKQ